jgi:hypothetical protein
MKNKSFEDAVTELQLLFSDLSSRKALNNSEIERFNTSQKAIISYYNFLNSVTGSIIYPWTDKVFIDAWDLWRAYKKQQFNFIYKSISEQAALQKLQKISGNDMQTAINIIKESIPNGWMGLFADKKKQIKQKTPTSYKQNITDRLIK